MAEDGRVTIKAILDQTQLDKGIAEMRRKLSKVSGKDLRDVADAAGEVDEKADDAADAVSDLAKDEGKAAGKAKDLSKDTGKAADKARDLSKRADKAADDVSGMGQQADKAADDVSGMAEDARKATGDVTDLGDAAEEAAGKFGSLDAVKGAVSGAVGGLTAGAIAKGVFGIAREYGDAEARLKAAFGLTADEAERLKDIGKEIYTDGWGDSLEAVNDALIEAKSTMRDLSGSDLQTVTQAALVMEDVFGADVNETLRGTNALMEGFGLSAQEAADLMAAGMQHGLNYTDELGDNLSEYSVRWGEAGMSASTYFSLLEAGTSNGAYNLDKVGDYLNEFLTSLSDGRMEEQIGNFSEGTQQMWQSYKDGSATAEDMLNAVVGELSGMTDETERARIASDLWSSLGEDNAMGMILSLGDVEDAYRNVGGTAQRMAEDASEGFSAKWESAMRTLKGSLDDIGDPLVELAGYVADLVSKFGKWFDGLTPGGKRAMATFAGIALAVKPAVKFLGSFAQGIGDAVEGMGKVRSSGGKAAQILSKFSGAAGAAKAGAIGLAVAGIGLLVAYLAKLYQEHKTLQKATDGMRSTMSGLEGATGDYARSARDARDATKDLIEQQAEMVDDIRERNQEVETSSALLDRYGQTIADLNGQQLDDEGAANLKNAVEQLNSQLGTTYEVVQGEDGVYRVMADGAEVATGQIRELIDAQQAQLRLSAANANLEDIYRQQGENARELATATAELEAAQQRYEDALATGDTGAITAASDAYADARKNVDELTAAQDALTASEQFYTDQATLATMATEEGASAYTRFLSENSNLQAGIESSGQSLLGFRDSLEQTGISTELLGSLSAAQLTQLAQDYDGTAGSIVGSLAEMAGGAELAGTDTATALTQSLMDGAESAGEGAEAMKEAIALRLTGGDMQAAADLLGHDISQGMRDGIAGTAELPAEAAAVMGEDIIEAARASLDSHSPAQTFVEIGNDIGEGAALGIQEGAQVAAQAASELGNTVIGGIQAAPETARAAGNQLGMAYASGIQSGASVAVNAGWVVVQLLVARLAQGRKPAEVAGKAVSQVFANGVRNGQRQAQAAGEAVSLAAASAFGGKVADAYQAGVNLTQGFANGIAARQYAAVNAAANMAQAAVDAAKRTLDVRSPSHVFEDIGSYAAEGAAIGIDEKAYLVPQAVTAMFADSAMAALEATAPIIDWGGAVAASGVRILSADGGGSMPPAFGSTAGGGTDPLVVKLLAEIYAAIPQDVKVECDKRVFGRLVREVQIG